MVPFSFRETEMLKLISLALAGLFLCAQPTNAAGTLPGFSLTPQFDLNGKVMPGCRLYTIVAGTTQTPQNSYQDSALTILQPNPLPCDATGRLPQFFLADGQVKIRLTNSAGQQQFVGDNLLVIGASSGGGGGGGSVDPTTVLATGDIKARYGTGVLTGFVRLNGRTIGSATSGATERANADTQALFEYLWNSSANLTVLPSRGASANADWTANKTIALPDGRGRVLAGLDDMGNSSASRLSFSLGANNVTLGAATTLDYEYLTIAMLPAHNHAVYLNDPGHAHTIGPPNLVDVGTGGITEGWRGNSNANRYTTSTNFTNITISSAPGGSGQPNATELTGSNQPHSTVQPTLLLTHYIKL